MNLSPYTHSAVDLLLNPFEIYHRNLLLAYTTTRKMIAERILAGKKHIDISKELKCSSSLIKNVKKLVDAGVDVSCQKESFSDFYSM